MENEKNGKEKTPFRKGFVAVLLLGLALLGVYDLLLALLNYLGVI